MSKGTEANLEAAPGKSKAQNSLLMVDTKDRNLWYHKITEREITPTRNKEETTMTNRIYTLPEDKNIQELAHAVEGYLTNSENMNCQVLKSDMGEYIVQGRAQNGKMTQWVGLDKAITVRLIPGQNNAVIVEIGNGEWLKKSLTMATSMFILWPLAVTSGVGMFKQGKLPQKIDRAIQMYIAGYAPMMAFGMAV